MLLGHFFILSLMIPFSVAIDDDIRPMDRQRLLELKRATLRHRARERLRHSTCTNTDTRAQVYMHSNHPAVKRKKRSVPVENARAGNDLSIRFNGDSSGVMQRDNDIQLPVRNFTVELWAKAESGQATEVNILGVYDTCLRHSHVPRLHWSVGITSQHGDDKDPRDAQFEFRARSFKSYKVTRISDHRKYRPNIWTHLAATYDGISLKFYLDGAKIGESRGTWGDLFSNDYDTDCVKLRLGGDMHDEPLFRGEIHSLAIYSRVLDHGQIVNLIKHHTANEPSNILHDSTVINDSFSDLSHWHFVTEKQASLTPSNFQTDRLEHDLGLNIPKCGETVCDDPEVVNSYKNNPALRYQKTLRYRVINVANDDGSNPHVTEEQINLQHDKLKLIFNDYNISLRLHQETVNNTYLRTMHVLYSCDIESIGNGVCNNECNYDVTDQDGGDCKESLIPEICFEESIGDGVCDPGCNNQVYDWDEGDCCLHPGSSPNTCLDPQSPHRPYMTLNEYKQRLGYLNNKYLNIYFAKWVSDIVGVAAFPWDDTAHTEQGGIALKPDNFGDRNATKNLVHEIGHALGLWHTFHGVDELLCDSPCLEVTPSLELGDLCSDTNPTTRNVQCADVSDQYFSCAVKKVGPTPFTNFMGYEGGECSEQEFTPQQTARMHCYLDLAHTAWLVDTRPGPVPLPPAVLNAEAGSVTISWVASLERSGLHEFDLCRKCDEELSLIQHATWASSPRSSNTGSADYAPHQATGAPNAETCKASPEAWIAYDETNFDIDNVSEDEFYIELGFEHPVIAQRVLIWVTWTSEGISDVILYDKNNQTVHLGKVHTYCDMPYATEVPHDIEVLKMRIYVTDYFTSIDAVAIQTKPNFMACKACDQHTYRLERNPPFTAENDVNLMYKELEGKLYTDRNMEQGVTYRYSVTVLSGDKQSVTSPELTYTHGSHFCGDGYVDGGEECDDGNLRDGDGCSLTCHIEGQFHCKDEPSLCYNHIGDGLCEDFERDLSRQDCGFTAPSGFIDQWAVNATQTGPIDGHEMLTNVEITGPPLLSESCKTSRESGILGTYTTTVVFAEPVVATSIIIYLLSDGMEVSDAAIMTVGLLGVNGEPIGPSEGISVYLACHNNPVHVNLVHDLSTPFYHTQGVVLHYKSSYVTISAVALRSYRYLVPLQLENSQHSQLFNPRAGRNVDYECVIPECEPYKVRHGSTQCSGYLDGDTCNVTCDQGYLLETYIDHTTCLNGAWEDEIACVPVTCDTPHIPFAKLDCPDGLTFNSRCRFDCRPPAVKIGTESLIQCRADGTWSMPDSYCQVMCEQPSVKAGTILTAACLAEESLPIGTKCRVTCSRGHRLTGVSSKKRATRMTCQEDGSWDAPTCERITCPAPDPVYKGLYSCSEEFYYKSICDLKCPGPTGLQSTSICELNGEWDVEFAPCKFETGSCPDIPSSPDRADFPCANVSIGESCNAVCPRQDDIAMLRYMSSIDGKMHVEHAHSVLCTGTLEWHPNPYNIICVPNCQWEWVDDTVCDGVNNNAWCEYDGGDCCASTRGAPVESLDPDCGAACECLDPSAAENSRHGLAAVRGHRKGSQMNRHNMVIHHNMSKHHRSNHVRSSRSTHSLDAP